MRVDLALVDEALLVRVHKLDGVFDGDDVVRAVFVDEIDDRRQRGGFPAARRTGDEHQALLQEAQFLDRIGQPEVLEA
jgi:hypothetical protein